MMLKGYLDCKDIGRYILKYINFDLSKKDMARVALHLRNCPICLEKYTCLQKRKTYLKKLFNEIDNNIRMQGEISCYVDCETTKDVDFIIEAMLKTSQKYREELKNTEELRIYLFKAKEIVKEKHKAIFANKIIARKRLKRWRKTKRILFWLQYLFQMPTGF